MNTTEHTRQNLIAHLADAQHTITGIIHELSQLHHSEPQWSQSAAGIIADMRAEDMQRAVEGLRILIGRSGPRIGI